MASVLAGLVALEQRVVVDADEAIVVAGGEQLLVAGHGDRVDVGAVAAFREDAFYVPAELVGLVSPFNASGVGGAGWISWVFLLLKVEEEELVGATVGSDPS